MNTVFGLVKSLVPMFLVLELAMAHPAHYSYEGVVEGESSLYIARSWLSQWDHERAQGILEDYPRALFFSYDSVGDSYTPIEEPFHFANLILGGRFPAALDPLGGLDRSETAVMDVLDPRVGFVENVHLRGIDQILVDINVMTEAEAAYLRGDLGI